VDSRAQRKAVSILFSEGSSLSARQTLSALGPLDYQIEVCDPNRFCISRFSRFVRRFHRSPAFGADPVAYWQFLLERLQQDRYDVLLPTHDQAFLFARMQHTLTPHVKIALSAFESFAQLQSKAAFAQVLTELKLPQPRTRFARSRADLEADSEFPYYIKHPYSTAGRDVWRVDDAAKRGQAIRVLEARGYLDGRTEVVIQDVANGLQCQAQTVFEHGSLIAIHCTSQRSVGVGGSQSARLSVKHPGVEAHLVQLGRQLSWHGALAVDYFFDTATNQPVYIEANPRLVEPMNGVLSGVNLPDILVRLSLGESFQDVGIQSGMAGIRSHSLLATLLGLGGASASRTRLMREVLRAILGRGVYAESREDLTPIRVDPFSSLPFLSVFVSLLFNPSNANRFSANAVADYSLTPKAVDRICGIENR
jgi:predicted ATP-grasp superfamily ATP-dependent carboligase